MKVSALALGLLAFALVRWSRARPEAAEPAPGRIWLDVGTGEGVRTVTNVRLLRELLLRKGYVEGESLRVMVAAGAAHNEAAWGRRIKKAIPFLLGA